MHIRTRRRPLVLFAAALACALVAIVMRVSLDRGRLSVAPRVDDVIYLARGAELWLAFQQRGVPGLLSDWRARPPHSPWSSTISAAGFTLAGGVREWAVYPFTAIPIAIFLFAAAHVCRRAGSRGVHRWPAFALLLLGATPAFLAASAYNLKPDYCAGILTAAAMLICLRAPVVIDPPSGASAPRFPRRRLWLAGALFGAALLAKPAMLLPTSLLALGTLAICLLRDTLLNRRIRVLPSLAACAIVLVAMLLIAGPHLALSWNKSVAYAARVLTEDTNRSWKYQGSLWQHLIYYSFGPGGRHMLDSWRAIIPFGIAILLAGAIALHRFSKRRRLFFASAILALAMTYLGPTISPVKISQFAAPFSALFCLLGLHSAAWLCARARRSPRPVLPRLAPLAIVIALAVSLSTYRWTFPSADNPQQTAERNRLTQEVYSAVRSAATARAAPTTLLIATSQTDLFDALFTLWSIRDRVTLTTIWLAPDRPTPGRPPPDFAAELSARSDAVARADLILTASGPTPLDWKPWHVEGWNAACFAHVAAHPQFHRIAEIPPFSLSQRRTPEPPQPR